VKRDDRVTVYCGRCGFLAYRKKKSHTKEPFLQRLPES
jgi:ribosomal protein L37E